MASGPGGAGHMTLGSDHWQMQIGNSSLSSCGWPRHRLNHLRLAIRSTLSVGASPAISYRFSTLLKSLFMRRISRLSDPETFKKN